MNSDDTNFDINNLPDIQSKSCINYFSIPTTFTLEEIFINLTLISKIEIGNKLFHTDKYVNIDNSYFQSIYRWYNNIDRNSSIKFINFILNESFIFNSRLLDENTPDSNLLLFRLTTGLKNAINGLTNLKQTYTCDKLIQSELDVMIDNIRSKIDANSKIMHK